MTEYEIYSYEAYRKKYQDDIRVVERADISSLNTPKLENYLFRLKDKKPNLAQLVRMEAINCSGGMSVSSASSIYEIHSGEKS